MYDHLIFYDGQCGLCDRAVHIVLKADHQYLFAFAPLQGHTAASLLKDIPEELRGADSVILIENYKLPSRHVSIRSKAAFRTCWLLGGWYRLIGWKGFLPAWLFDWGYRLIATNRHRLFPPVSCIVPDLADKERFLD